MDPEKKKILDQLRSELEDELIGPAGPQVMARTDERLRRIETQLLAARWKLQSREAFNDCETYLAAVVAAREVLARLPVGAGSAGSSSLPVPGSANGSTNGSTQPPSSSMPR